MTKNICCACGGPGMTQVETGKWLCQRHSPYTSSGPKHDEYLKQKGVELFYLMREVIWCLNELKSKTDEDGQCPICELQQHSDSCPIGVLSLVCDLTLFEYHPYLFFDQITQDNMFLQECRVFGEPSKYITELRQKYLLLTKEKLKIDVAPLKKLTEDPNWF